MSIDDGGSIDTDGNILVHNNALGVTRSSNGTVYLILETAAGGYGHQIQGKVDGDLRWQINLGNADGESGTNAGSNLAFLRHADDGSYIDEPFRIIRSNGNILVGGGFGHANGGITMTTAGVLQMDGDLDLGGLIDFRATIGQFLQEPHIGCPGRLARSEGQRQRLATCLSTRRKMEES